jgi:hypothetical protein
VKVRFQVAIAPADVGAFLVATLVLVGQTEFADRLESRGEPHVVVDLWSILITASQGVSFCGRGRRLARGGLWVAKPRPAGNTARSLRPQSAARQWPAYCTQYGTG